MGNFRFNPHAGLLPDGVYLARIKGVQFRQSKSGNDMAVVTLAVEAPDGNEVDVTDYLVSTTGGTWKIIAFCEATGLDPQQGTFDALDVIGIRVAVELETRAGTQKNDGTFFPDQNAVKNYILGGEKPVRQKPPQATNLPVDDMGIPDDTLPF